MADDNRLGNQGVVIIKMSCEANCEWEMVFAGHKGTLAGYVQNGKSVPWSSEEGESNA
jgi:hypothetical protein